MHSVVQKVQLCKKRWFVLFRLGLFKSFSPGFVFETIANISIFITRSTFMFLVCIVLCFKWWVAYKILSLFLYLAFQFNLLLLCYCTMNLVIILNNFIC